MINGLWIIQGRLMNVSTVQLVFLRRCESLWVFPNHSVPPVAPALVPMKETLLKLRQYLLNGVLFSIPFIAFSGILITSARPSIPAN
jgi:hypothetical protein